MTFYMHPQTEKKVPMSPEVAPTGGFADAEDYRRMFPDGRIGSNPNLSTAEHGKRFYETAVEEVAKDYLAFTAN
jgi:creatinine amidohydrolase